MNLVQGLEKLKEGYELYDTKYHYVFFFEDVKDMCSKLMYYRINNPKDVREVEFKNIKLEHFIEDRFVIFEKVTLDKKEVKYLENVLEPFKDRVISIERVHYDEILEYIQVVLKKTDFTSDGECISLPYFEAGTRYKEMKIWKEYTPRELGLFE